LAVLIVAYRETTKLAQCLRSVQVHLPDAPVHVWDNSGPDVDAVRRMSLDWPGVRWYLGSDNLGFAAAANCLMDHIGGADALLLNPDAELTNSLPLTRAALAGPRVAAAAPKVVDFVADPGRRQGWFSRRLTPWDVAHKRLTVVNAVFSRTSVGPLLRGTWLSNLYRRQPTEVAGYLTGACLAIANAAWEELGPFDEEFFLYAEEAHWQWRATSAGWRLLLVEEVGARHVAKGTVSGDTPGSTRSSDLLEANVAMQLELERGRWAAEVFLACTSAIEQVRRIVRRRALPDQYRVVLTVARSAGPQVADRQVALAKELAQSGSAVTVVSLERLGSLPRSIPSSVRLLRRPSWWPAAEVVRRRSVVIHGSSPGERRFARLWRLRRLSATVTVGDSIEVSGSPQAAVLAACSAVRLSK
jgi:GT2 family glycosyltransferase